jgi:hypothetical protein
MSEARVSPPRQTLPTSVNRTADGSHSDFWRELSWRLGDEHADRICRWVDFYCWLFSVGHERFYRSVPK